MELTRLYKTKNNRKKYYDDNFYLQIENALQFQTAFTFYDLRYARNNGQKLQPTNLVLGIRLNDAITNVTNTFC